MPENPLLRLQYYKETGQTEQAKLYEQYLRETGQIQSAPGVRPDATAALPRDRKNASGDLEALLSGGQGRVLTDDVLPTLAAHALNFAQAVPGARYGEALAGSVGSKFTDHPMGFGESLAALDEETGKIPESMRVAEQLVGLPEAIPALGAGVKAGARYLPAAKAAAREMSKDIPFVRRFGRAANAAKRIQKALPSGEVIPIRAPAKIAEDAPRTLEEALGLTPESMGLTSESAPLEQRIGDVVQNASPFKQRSAPKARFDYFADRMAKRAAAQAEESAEPSLEDLLSASLEHIKKGGSLRQASDVASKVRR